MAVADDEAQWRWFIDAWVPADGIAFISLRGPRTDIWLEEDAGAQEATALFLRAPSFEPEAIERRVAFGAVQRGAQEGFSLDGVGEFGFASVAQVIEFVRRVYVGTGPLPAADRGAPPLPGAPGLPGGTEAWPELDIEPGADVDAAWSLGYDESADGAALGRRMASACSATVRRAAANLLIRSVRATFDGGADGDDEDRVATVWPQLHAALLLTADAAHFWLKRFAQTLGDEKAHVADLARKTDLAVLGVLVNDFFYMRPGFMAVPWSGGFDWRRGRIPAAAALPLQLPAHVDTWLAALCYLCADRRYLCRQPFSVWGPLLLALTAPTVGSSGWSPSGSGWRNAWSTLVTRSMRAAAELLPAQALPSSLEDNIESWCRRGVPHASTPAPTTPAAVQSPQQSSAPTRGQRRT